MSLHNATRLSAGLITRSSVRYTSAFRHRMMLREPQPDDNRIAVGGIPIVIPPKPKLTGVVESRDPEEWKFVDALLPNKVVPEPPKHANYPTPSGWVPPKENIDSSYRVIRSRFHNFPIYLRQLEGGNRYFTVISKVEGNIWDCDADVREYVSNVTGKQTYTRVDEVCRKLWVRGKHVELLSQFLIEKGF